MFHSLLPRAAFRRRDRKSEFSVRNVAQLVAREVERMERDGGV